MKFFEVCTESERADILSAVQEGGWYAFFTLALGTVGSGVGPETEVVMRIISQIRANKIFSNPKVRKYLELALEPIAKKEKGKGSVPADPKAVSTIWHNNDNMSIYKSISGRGAIPIKIGEYTVVCIADSKNVIQMNSMWKSKEGKVYPVKVPAPSNDQLKEFGWDSEK